MNMIVNWIKGNPTRVAAIVMILISWLAMIDVPAEIIGGLGTIVGIITGSVVWGQVNTIDKTIKAVEEAATSAATEALKRIDEGGIGAVGKLTESGTAAVTNAANEAVDQVLLDIGIRRGPPAKKVA